MALHSVLSNRTENKARYKTTTASKGYQNHSYGLQVKKNPMKYCHFKTMNALCHRPVNVELLHLLLMECFIS